MKKLISILAVLSLVAVFSPAAFATNGTNLIGIGPIARSMGGVGIAAPQDAISAVFSNPAAMCFGPYCPSSQFDFAGTAFAPKIEGKVTRGSATLQADSHDTVYAIPAIGISTPLTKGAKPWRFGLAAYGVSGLGVDYRDTNLDDPSAIAATGAPVAGTYTQLQVMKFAPAVAWQALNNLSLGVAVHLDFSGLDLRNGTSYNYGLGVQLGLIYMPTDKLSLGFNYVSPQSIKYENVFPNKNAMGNLVSNEDLKLESPMQIGFGAAYTFFDTLLTEVNVKWLNWADADGYGKQDFDWDDQWVVALGAQYEVIPKLYLRAGYNYAENPVKEHNNFGPGTTTVQGITVPTFAYEEFRIIGFPAVVEHHITFGIGYEFSEKFSLNLGYVHAFENSIKETGTGPGGVAETLESTLSEHSLDFGLTWRF